jgi:hypothetical protein
MTTHMDFSDLPLLGARDTANEEKRAGVLAVVRSYTLAFFNQNLEGKKLSLLDRAAGSEFVEAVQRFEPANPPCRQ